jgi:hypothetical protein
LLTVSDPVVKLTETSSPRLVLHAHKTLVSSQPAVIAQRQANVYTKIGSPEVLPAVKIHLSPQYMPGTALSLKRCRPTVPLLILPESSLVHITRAHRLPSTPIPKQAPSNIRKPQHSLKTHHQISAHLLFSKQITSKIPKLQSLQDHQTKKTFPHCKISNDAEP